MRNKIAKELVDARLAAHLAAFSAQSSAWSAAWSLEKKKQVEMILKVI